MPCLRRFLSPSMQQLQQCALVDRELLQRLALDARHDAGDEPARQAQFDYGRARGSAQIVQLLHGVLHRFTSATMDAISSPPPHSISLGGLRTPAPRVRGTTVMGPASENLHMKRHPRCKPKEKKPPRGRLFSSSRAIGKIRW